MNSNAPFDDDSLIPDEDHYYPIIFYGPNLVPNDKSSSIHSFSDFQDCLKFAQSLNTSFLLIISNDHGLQEAFKDMCPRRLADFEEESLMKELFPSQQPYENLKAYVFSAAQLDDVEQVTNKEEMEKIKAEFPPEIMNFMVQEILRESQEESNDHFNSDSQIITELPIGIESYPLCKEFCKRALQCLVKTRKRERRKSVYFLKLGEISETLEEYQDALKYYTQAFDLKKTISKETQNSSFGILYTNFADVHRKLGEYHKALEFYSKALEIRINVHGEKHAGVAKSYSNLGKAYKCLGDLPKALESYQKSLKIREDIHKENNHSLADSYQDVAIIWKDLGDYPKAIEYQLKSLEKIKSISGETHLNTGNSYKNLALMSYNMKDYQNALQYYQKALDIAILINTFPVA